MIVTCDRCHTRFKLKQKPTAVKVRCSRCKHIFILSGGGKTQAASDNLPKEPSVETAIATTAPNEPASGMPETPVAGPYTKKTYDLKNIIAVSNQKGGVAKTTTCLNFGIALSLMKKRVLLVDFDIQANLTLSLGYRNTASFYEVMKSEDHNLPAFLIKTKYPNLWLLPANKNMVLLNKLYFGTDGFEYLLRNHLLPLKDSFDAIVIDTPPSIEFFTINALTAAGAVIIPSQCEFMSTHGINQIVKMIELIRQKTNPTISYRVLLTMFDQSDIAARMIRDKLSRMYNGQRYKTVIELDGKVREAQVMRTPVVYYDKTSRAGRQYVDLAKEYLTDPPTARVLN